MRDGGCYADVDCGQGYQCDGNSGACVAPSDAGDGSCRAPTDCDAGYTCGKNGACLPGDCSFNGCVTGFQCESSTGRWECAPGSDGGAAGASNEDTAQAGTSGSFDAAGQGG